MKTTTASATASSTTASVKRFGNKNAWIITRADGVVLLRSYDTPVAAVIDGVFYATSEKWSVTTTKQIGQFCGLMIKECKVDLLLSAADRYQSRPQSFFYDLAGTPESDRRVRYWQHGA